MGIARPIDRARNFFGVVFVEAEKLEHSDQVACLLVNGRITHGAQFVDPAKRRQPTFYYGEQSGVGRAIRYLQRSGPVCIGAIGLGAGTLAVYTRPRDTIVFYEINPQVYRMAMSYFTFLRDCRGKPLLVMGDARLWLEAELARQRPRVFDLLVVDAFSGDAIPVHLVTREALRLYCRRLAPNGIIAFHVSNRYLRLAPIVRRLAEDCGMLATRISDDPGKRGRDELLMESTWVLLTRNREFVRANPSEPPSSAADDDPNVPLWTDQYSNLFRILKRP